MILCKSLLPYYSSGPPGLSLLHKIEILVDLIILESLFNCEIFFLRSQSPCQKIYCPRGTML